MSVLITGGTGTIGVDTVLKFAKEGFNVVIYSRRRKDLKIFEEIKDRIVMVEGNIEDLSKLTWTVKQYNVEGIIHLAAIIFESVCRENLIECFKINVLGTLNVLEAARSQNLKKVIYASSRAVFGERKGLEPIKEDDPINPSGFYGYTKAISETLMEAYYKIYNINSIIIRTAWVYGIGQTELFHPITRYLKSIAKGEEVREDSGADFFANFSYSKDVANGIYMLYTANKLKHRVYHVGSGKNYTINEVVNAIKKVIPEAKISIGPGLGDYIKEHPLRGPLDITRIKEELGFKPYELEEAIKDYYALIKKFEYI